MLILLKESVVTACWLSLQGIAGRLKDMKQVLYLGTPLYGMYKPRYINLCT